MFETIIILLLILALGGAGYYTLRSHTRQIALETERTTYERRLAERDAALRTAESRLSDASLRIEGLTVQVARLEAEREGLLIAIAERKKEIDDAKKEFKLEFENIAGRIFEANRTTVAKENREQIETILKPLKEKLGEFQHEIKDVHEKGVKTNATLMEQIRQLTEMNQTLSSDAKNLTRALRGESKTQGNWGELILEDLLQSSGLERGREYIIQGEGLGLRSETGTSVKPDVIIRLPEDRSIVIDAKVSLTDYERFTSAEDDTDKKTFLGKHVASIRAHVDELAWKDYSANEGLRSPDFVMMFVPIEASLTLALTTDSTLFTYAWERKIVLVSPTTLLVSLKTVAILWRHEKQTKNVLEIARIGGQLYEKFIGFLKDMDSVKKNLESSLESHANAMGKLKDGRGSITKTIENLKKLGAKTEKQIEGKHIDDNIERSLPETTETTIAF